MEVSHKLSTVPHPAPSRTGGTVGWETLGVTSLSSVFLAAAVVAAVLDWVAVARGSAVLEYVSKPAATAAFLAVTATLDVSHDAPWGWRLAALALCILGDVFLMLPRDAFVPGLASFAVAQVLFAISFVTGETSGLRLLVGLVVVGTAAVVLAGRFVAGIRQSGHAELVGPVIAYMAVISAMTVGAVGSGSLLAVLGAAVFMVSDSLIAESRFVKPQPWHPVGIMVTYHLALAGLVLGLL